MKEPGTASSCLQLFEQTAYVAGTLLLCLALGALAQSDLRRARAVEELPAMELWSPEARARYLQAVKAGPAPVLGALHAPAIGLEAPIYEDASDLNLDRGAGVVSGMAYPHELGHIGIAGHRDGYFRALKDLQVGDELRLETLAGTKTFVVDDLRIVEPTELSYLQETEDQRLTLVTCYPFYFVGDAPQRYLVRAAPLRSARAPIPSPPETSYEEDPDPRSPQPPGRRQRPGPEHGTHL